MSITDYLRLYVGQIEWAAIGILVLFTSASLVASRLDPEGRKIVRTARNWLVIFASASLAVYLLTSTTTNTVPRGKIDRTIVDRQQQQYEQSLRK